MDTTSNPKQEAKMKSKTYTHYRADGKPVQVTVPENENNEREAVMLAAMMAAESAIASGVKTRMSSALTQLRAAIKAVAS